MKLFLLVACRFVFPIPLLFLLILSGDLIHSRVVKTKFGLIEGVKRVARNQKYFHAYYGIPYAKPPVGKLRFEPPVEADPWEGILNGTQKSDPCPQVTSEAGDYKGKEDCLFLHVFAPSAAKPGSDIPVIFYIFGGAFESGDPLKEGAEFFLSRNVILVEVSHRLGVLGFLSTGDTILPGNMGMKDQVLAMKWTKENIYHFGGDPDRITIQGHSSGAMSAHLHTFSPLSQDYFSQVIMQSGLGVNPQSFWDPHIARSIAFRLAEHINCSTESSILLRKCLKAKGLRELLLTSDQLHFWHELHAPILFKPVIENEDVEGAFLTENPLFASYKSQSKPWLLGITSDEGAETVSEYLISNPEIFELKPELWLPVLAFFKWTSKPNHIDFIVQVAKTHFFNEQKINNATASGLVKFLNGIMFGDGLINVVRKYRGVKYLYLFDYRYVGGYTDHNQDENVPYLGVGHADELAIMFDRTNGEKITAEDFAFGDEMITRWVNFAHSGNPNVPFLINTSIFGAWKPTSMPHLEFLRITNNGSMEKDYFLQEYGFWQTIPYFSRYSS